MRCFQELTRGSQYGGVSRRGPATSQRGLRGLLLCIAVASGG